MKYFRNKYPIGDIEKDALWCLQDTNLVLADEDDFLCLDFKEYHDLFYEVETPES